MMETMKLLYATSVSYPSSMANRIQILHMARAFYGHLGEDFVLGLADGSSLANEDFNTVSFLGSRLSPILALKYLRIIKKEQFTHVLCREDRLLFFLMLYAFFARLPVVFVFEAHWRLDNLFFRFVLAHVPKIITITHALARELEMGGVVSDRICVCPDGVDLAQYTHLPKRDRVRKKFHVPVNALVIGYTGSIGRHAWKGVDVLLEAAKQAPKGWYFWIVGSASDELRHQFPGVHFEGRVDNAETPAIQSACDVLVLPNRSGTAISEQYTSPLKLFEYMASGAPIVASNLPSIREVLANNDSAVLVEPNDPEALLYGIQKVLDDPMFAKHISQNALKEVVSYGWSDRAARIISFVSES